MTFDFWFYGTGSGLTYQAEISDNRCDPGRRHVGAASTTSSPTRRRVAVHQHPLRRLHACATDFQPGGAPDDGFTLTEIWAWAIVLPHGVDIVYFDDVALGLNVIDDFESGLPQRHRRRRCRHRLLTPSRAPAARSAISTAATPPAPAVPAAGGEPEQRPAGGRQRRPAFAGFIHGFENEAVDTWVAAGLERLRGLALLAVRQQHRDDSSSSTSSTTATPARRPTTPSASRSTSSTTSPAGSSSRSPSRRFSRKEIGNGAPNDGLQPHRGARLGVRHARTPAAPLTNYLDDVALYGVAEVPELAVSFAAQQLRHRRRGRPATITVKLNRPMNDDDPGSGVGRLRDRDRSSPIAGRGLHARAAGTLTFVNGGPSELTFPFETFDDTKYEGDERIDPAAVQSRRRRARRSSCRLGAPSSTTTRSIRNAARRLRAGARTCGTPSGNVTLANPELATRRSRWHVPGQDAIERVLEATVPLAVDIVVEGDCLQPEATGSSRSILLSHRRLRRHDGRPQPTVTIRRCGRGPRRQEDRCGQASRGGRRRRRRHRSGVPLPRRNETGSTCELRQSCRSTATPSTASRSRPAAPTRRSARLPDRPGLDRRRGARASGTTAPAPATRSRSTAQGQPRPRSRPVGLGAGRGATSSTSRRARRRTRTTGRYEIGDGTVNGIPGWGNDELQYYTDDPANAATDGNGNLVITAARSRRIAGVLLRPLRVHVGPTRSPQKRPSSPTAGIESRILVPDGERRAVAGVLEPRHRHRPSTRGRRPVRSTSWSTSAGCPNEIFGTIHGPGYSAAAASATSTTSASRCTTTTTRSPIEWQPDLIELVRGRHPVPHGDAGRRCAEPVGLQRTRSSCCSTSPSAATSAAR